MTNSNEPRSAHEKYAEDLKRHIAIVWHSLALKAAIWDRFSIGLSNSRLDPKATFAAAHLIAESLETEIVLILSKLLEKKERSDKNLFRFLDFTENNRIHIAWAEPLSQIQLESHRNAIEAHRSIINSVLGQRDKYFAHSDKDFFLDPDLRHERYPFDFADVVTLIQTLQHVLGEHSRALSNSVPIGLDGFARVAADQFLLFGVDGEPTSPMQ